MLERARCRRHVAEQAESPEQKNRRRKQTYGQHNLPGHTANDQTENDSAQKLAIKRLQPHQNYQDAQ